MLKAASLFMMVIGKIGEIGMGKAIFVHGVCSMHAFVYLIYICIYIYMSVCLYVCMYVLYMYTHV